MFPFGKTFASIASKTLQSSMLAVHYWNYKYLCFKYTRHALRKENR